MATDTELAFCGHCIAALDGFRCPVCSGIWAERLTETEARAFRAGWYSDNTGDPVIDAWRAVRIWREHGRPPALQFDPGLTPP